MSDEITNEDRRERARKTLDYYTSLIGDVQCEDTITDLLVDLFHLCDEMKVDTQELVDSADMHYTAERDDG